MGQYKDIDFSHQNRVCAQCGSTNWQSLEVAYDQSVRQTEGGYRSVSKFGESIAPPEKRSIIGGPLFTAVGLASATLLFLPIILERSPQRESILVHVMEAHAYTPAVAVGVIVFVVKAIAAVRYNGLHWPAKYENWRHDRICRRCGHRSNPSGRQSVIQQEERR